MSITDHIEERNLPTECEIPEITDCLLGRIICIDCNGQNVLKTHLTTAILLVCVAQFLNDLLQFCFF